MKIWIDGYEANVPERLGSSQVGYELLVNFEKLDYENEYTILLPDKPCPDLPKERQGWRYRILKPSQLWTRIALPFALYTTKVKPDLIYSPTHYIPRFSPVKRIATIFDLSYLHFPKMIPRGDLWKMRNWGKFSIKNSNHIITISNFSKNDIIKNYNVDKEKITVAYPGFNKDIFISIKDQGMIESTKRKYGISGKYIIFVGTIQPRKNLVRLIEAFRSIEDLKLVIVGKTKGLGRQGWMFEEILAKPKELGIEDKVLFTNFVPSYDLPSLISGADVFILPSLWEGFGIPVVEAMACGTPVIVSNISSLPEVVGKAGLLIDPYSTTQIEQAIRTITSDKKLHDKKARECLQRVKKFSWEKMAKTILRVFQEVNSA